MNATTLSHEMQVGTPERTESARILGAVDDNETLGYYYVLVSTLDSMATPVVFFPYPPSLHITRECPPGYEVRRVPAKSSSGSARIGYAFIKRYMYNAMRNVFKAANLHRLATTSHSGTSWNIFWGDHLKAAEYAALGPHQRVNHFPGSFELGRKDRLCRNLLRFRKKHPDAYADVIPETYVTANEYDKQQFLQQYAANPRTLWILKPPNLSCGRGIKIVAASTTPTLKLTKKKEYVAQRYVANPFLIHELKFDLRVYVAVTSYDPLRIYVYNDGLVRFCTEKYSTSKAGLQNQFGHLTNYSVNKKNDAAFQPNDDREEEGGGSSSSKWSLQSFYKYVTEQGKVQELSTFKEALNDLIVKTFIAVESKILMQTPTTGGAHSSGFELYGFDILLEGEEMKPWLLEVNVFPSLSSSSPMDKRIKTMLVSDLFQLVGVPFQDAGAVAEQVERDKNDRLLGITRKTKKTSSETVEKSKRTRTVDELATCKAALLTELDAVDLHIVQALQEEDARRGHFERIFPTADSWQKYGGLFETHRYKNVLCMRWLETLQQHPVRRRSASASTHQRRRPAS